MTELCVPLSLPEIKLLDVSKNNLEKVSPGFLAGCPKLETLNISVNKIGECGGVGTLGICPRSRKASADVPIFAPSPRLFTTSLLQNHHTEAGQQHLH